MNAPLRPASIEPGEQALAWDVPTRLFKWSLVFVVADGWLSNAFGAAWPAWHKWNGYVALVLIVFRLLWGFVGGSTARFSRFISGPRRTFDYVVGLLRGAAPKYLGHNPLGGWMVAALLSLVALQGVSGLFAADEDRLVIEGPLARIVADATVDFAARWHHRIFDAIEILALVHIAANLFYAFVKREPLVGAMIGGRKPAERYVDEASARAGSWLAAFVCLAVAVVVVFGSIAAAGGRLF